jgi:hypothetical protein
LSRSKSEMSIPRQCCWQKFCVSMSSPGGSAFESFLIDMRGCPNLRPWPVPPLPPIPPGSCLVSAGVFGGISRPLLLSVPFRSEISVEPIRPQLYGLAGRPRYLLCIVVTPGGIQRLEEGSMSR